MAEGARLESVYTATYREFESLTHRHISKPLLLRGFLVSEHLVLYVKATIEATMQPSRIPSVRAKSARQCNYLIQTKTGVYTFRWNIIINEKHYQSRLSLKTRDYLEAVA